MRLSDDLRLRCKRYASRIIRLYATLPKTNKEVEILGLQLLRSGTSIAAHSREASRARSDSEFCSKIGGLLQEADESLLWLELLNEDCHVENPEINSLLDETSEILAIFSTIVSKVRQRSGGAANH
jgi:four helix bundle protein